MKKNESLLLTNKEEDVLKAVTKKAIEDMEREYIRILDESREDFIQAESDVKNVLYFHLRKRIEKLKNKRIKKNFHRIVLTEPPAIRKRKFQQRLDFGVFNIDSEKKLISIVAIEIKLRYRGFRKKRFKEIIKNDLKKLKKEHEWNRDCDCYLIFIHLREYKDNREEKIREFKEGFKELKKKLKLKGIELHYIQSKRPENMEIMLSFRYTVYTLL